jgi:hypothetical protein
VGLPGLHNPQVGGSIPPPATNQINSLQSLSFFTITRVPSYFDSFVLIRHIR